MTRLRDAKGRFMASPTETRTLTASVADVPSERIESFRTVETWQTKAWKLWRILGVLHYPTSFMAEQVSRCDWDVSVDGKRLDPEAAKAAVEAVTSPEGVREITRRLALNLEVAGEVYYLRSADVWQTLSAGAPKFKERLQAADISMRGFLADPVDPTKPDSPVRSALDVAEEIRVMAALSRSQSRNRLAQRGILLRPTEGKFPEGDDFTARFRATVTAPLADEYDSSSVTPLDVEFPGDLIEKWRHLLIESPYDDKLQERLENAIKRLALSLNMPPEVLLGNIDSSHWNAWLSEESTYRAHVEPLAMLVGSILAMAMQKASGLPGKIIVTPDPAKLLARRSSIADAFKGFELGVVNAPYVRRVMGADEDDAPDALEPAVELAVKLVQGAPSLVGILGISDIVGQLREVLGGKRPQLPKPSGEPGPKEPGPPDMPGNGSGPVRGAIEDKDAKELDRLSRQLLMIDVGLLGTLTGLARMATEQIREGNAADDVGVQERVAAEMGRLGRAWSKEIGRAQEALRALGIKAEGPEWDQAAEASVALLVDGMTDYVTSTLDRTDSEMPAIPVVLLRQAIATAGGSGTATVAAVTRLPAGGVIASFADPQGYALSVLVLRSLKGDGIEIVQWRFRYGPEPRKDPFIDHRKVDGQFMTAEGLTREGWHPNDHGGCLCWSEAVFRRVKSPDVP